MIQPMRHTAADGIKMGLKARIAALLRERCEEALAAKRKDAGQTIGEIGAALSLPKTEHGALSAALVKLRSEGKVTAASGPATANLGPRFVKRYLWKHKAEKPAPTPSPKGSDDRRFLSLCR